MLAMDTIINGLNVTGVMLMVFGVGGMLVWPVIALRKTKRCSAEVEATVTSYTTLHSSGHHAPGTAPNHVEYDSMQAAIFSYTYEGNTYTSGPEVNTNGICDPIGTVRTFRVNPENPQEYIASKKRNRASNIFMMIIFAIVAVVGVVKLKQ
ncbi:MAG: DUF3592 domain-containing protein [Oscillospiraceae bacterium]|nr:DUF3592 domain-containing protein [Oscillospiraceae bacterium]